MAFGDMENLKPALPAQRRRAESNHRVKGDEIAVGLIMLNERIEVIERLLKLSPDEIRKLMQSGLIPLPDKSNSDPSPK